MSLPVVHHSLNSILNILKDKKFENNTNIQELLTIYNNNCDLQSEGQKNHQFIVLEGLDGSGKSTTGRKLANKIGAELCVTPPACIQHLRGVFDDDLLLRSAYYSLGNYIAVAQIKKTLETKPVVLDRFWHSTAAHAIAEAIKQNLVLKLPEKQDNIYMWPSDLLKPDIVLFLTVSEATRLYRQRNRRVVTNQEQNLNADKDFRNNIYVAYNNMAESNFHSIDSNKTVRRVLDDIRDKCNFSYLY